MQLEVPFEICYVHQVVHRLKGVNDVHLIVIGIVTEIAICDFCGEVEEAVGREVEGVKDVVHLTHFEHQVLDSVSWQDLVKVEGVKARLFEFLECILKVGPVHIFQIYHVEELTVLVSLLVLCGDVVFRPGWQ